MNFEINFISAKYWNDYLQFLILVFIHHRQRHSSPASWDFYYNKSVVNNLFVEKQNFKSKIFYHMGNWKKKKLK